MTSSLACYPHYVFSSCTSSGQFLKILRTSVRSQDFILGATGATEGNDTIYIIEISLASLRGIKYKRTKMEDDQLGGNVTPQPSYSTSCTTVPLFSLSAKSKSLENGQIPNFTTVIKS